MGQRVRRWRWVRVKAHHYETGRFGGTALVLTLDCDHVVRKPRSHRVPRRAHCERCIEHDRSRLLEQTKDARALAERMVHSIVRRLESAFDKGRTV